MRKYFVSMVIAFSALVMLSGCVVSEEKLTDKVQEAMVEYEQEYGNRLEVTDLKLEKSEGKGYKGVLTGKLNGEDATYDVTVRFFNKNLAVWKILANFVALKR